MLQLVQLKDVAARYAREIAELRQFFTQADSDVETGQSLNGLASRLRHDRGFHRDLTSHVWVMIHRWSGQLSYSDLLGILASAAAGTQFAAEADDSAAHDLLHFLMKARDSFDKVPEADKMREAERPPGVGGDAPAGAVQARIHRTDEPLAPLRGQENRSSGYSESSSSAHSSPSSVRWGTDRQAKRFVFLAAASIVVACIVGLLWSRRTSSAVVDQPSPAYVLPATGTTAAVASAATGTAARVDARTSEPRSNEVVARAGRVTAMPGAPRSSTFPSSTFPFSRLLPGRFPSDGQKRVQTAASTADSRRPEVPSRALPHVSAPSASASARVAPLQPATAAMDAKSMPGMTATLSPGSYPASASALLPSGTRPAPVLHPSTAIVPAATLSHRLGARSVPVESAADDGSITGTANTPHLLRRKPRGTGALSQDDANLVAGVSPADLPARAGGSRTAPANATDQGIVRPVSLGMMAARVLYSPAPAYPAAASAAHVQGEVKIQAEVDRAGNVASARVISGPPQLRDAALDAVQRWRYRPYLTAGKPAPMTAVAVVAFELP